MQCNMQVNTVAAAVYLRKLKCHTNDNHHFPVQNPMNTTNATTNASTAQCNANSEGSLGCILVLYRNSEPNSSMCCSWDLGGQARWIEKYTMDGMEIVLVCLANNNSVLLLFFAFKHRHEMFYLLYAGSICGRE